MQKNRSVAEEIHIRHYVFQGIKGIIQSKVKLGAIAASLLLFTAWYVNAGILAMIMGIIVYLAGIVGFILLNSLLLRNLLFRKGLIKIQFKNRNGEYPYLISYEKENDGFIAGFVSEGIPVDAWRDSISLLENALNITIYSINIESRNDHIYIKYSEGVYDFKNPVELEDSVLSDPTSRICLGRNGMGDVSIDLSKIPHMLIGGQTGGGKTMMLISIILQCINKGYDVDIIDFKYGVDFPWTIRQRCVFVTEMRTFHEELTKIHEDMENRLKRLAECKCRNIDDYIKRKGRDCGFTRRIICIDEFADIVESKSISKEEKERAQQIIGMLTNVARKGRAAGVHLLLSLQRPDATVLSTAIRNNIAYKAATRCEDNLSRIILDNGDAADRLPTDTNGVFLDNMDNIYKGFYVDEDLLERGCYYVEGRDQG